MRVQRHNLNANHTMSDLGTGAKNGYVAAPRDTGGWPQAVRSGKTNTHSLAHGAMFASCPAGELIDACSCDPNWRKGFLIKESLNSFSDFL
jgi:hypothetical protein